MHLQLDIRSLLVAVTLASAFCAGARLLLWRMHPALPGLAHWALAGGLATLTLFLILANGITPWPPFLALAQLAVVLGLVMSWDGFRRFIGQPPLSLRTLLGISALALAWIVVAHPMQSLEIKALGNDVLIASLSGLIARELLTTPDDVPPAMRVTGWLYGLNALVFLARVIAVPQGTPAGDPMNPNGIAPFMLLWWLCMIIAVTLGMVLMAAERLQADLDNQANRDHLTGAFNRRAFALIAEKAIARSRRSAKPLSVLVMDLDNFKHVNDRHGHEAGDTLLCRFVVCANKIFRGEDVFCRFGGEEFVALLPNTSAEQAQVAAERLRTVFAAEADMEKTLSMPITVSIGIAERDSDEAIESLLQRADAALYQAKNRGRNRCELAEPA
ncbi:MAG: diguanylate cyclase [Gammaproteobacteria bacterium]|nr:diguanylate cyclase [Gammaproteobacteria bacterium]